MLTYPLVGVLGKKRAGKDTFARFLIEQHGYQRVAFADPIREGLLALNPKIGRPPLPGELLPRWDVRLSEYIAAYGWERAKELSPEVRHLMQDYGVGLRDTVGDSIWLDAALRKADAVGGPVVITDVRFRNEAERVRDRGGVLVRVTRPGQDETDRHASEIELDDWAEDYLVENTGTVADLARHASRVDREAVLRTVRAERLAAL